MSEDTDRSNGKPQWRVDEEESRARLPEEDHWEPPKPGGEGKLVYVDEQGQHRRLPVDMTVEERDAASAALSSALGGPSPDDARLAAIERLNELRAAGVFSEEDFNREKRRLMGLG
jgi:Short C-terminal domain